MQECLGNTCVGTFGFSRILPHMPRVCSVQNLHASIGRDVIHLARSLADWRSWAVVRRNGRVYFRGWYTGLLPPAVEPVLFLLAFGVGLGGWVGGIEWRGQLVNYAAYIAPGIIAYTSFTTPFFNMLWVAFVRMRYQKTWDGLLTTQVEMENVLCGEILWAGLLGTVFAAIVSAALAICHAVGLVSIAWWLLPALWPLSFIAGCAFAAFGLVFTAMMPSIDHINLPGFLIGMPVAFISDTYFPVTSEHPLVRFLMVCNPVHHLAETFRAILLGGDFCGNLIGLLATSAALLAISAPVALKLMRRRVLGEG
jgi:lipooligosaccharide transport system permease protein